MNIQLDNHLSKSELDLIGLSIVDLVVKAGLTASKNEARRAIGNGGVRIGDVKIESDSARLVIWQNRWTIVYADRLVVLTEFDPNRL